MALAPAAPYIRSTTCTALCIAWAAAGRDEGVVHRQVVAVGAAHAQGVPAIQNLALLCTQDGAQELRGPVDQPRLVAIHHLREQSEPARLVAAAGQVAAPADAVAA